LFRSQRRIVKFFACLHLAVSQQCSYLRLALLIALCDGLPIKFCWRLYLAAAEHVVATIPLIIDDQLQDLRANVVDDRYRRGVEWLLRCLRYCGVHKCQEASYDHPACRPHEFTSIVRCLTTRFQPRRHMITSAVVGCKSLLGRLCHLRPADWIVNNRMVYVERSREAIEPREKTRSRNAHLKQVLESLGTFSPGNDDLQHVVLQIVARQSPKIIYERL